MNTRRDHWEGVYGTKSPLEVSWYQSAPTLSLDLIRAAGLNRTTPLIDVGGGASPLADALLADGFGDVTVLDISAGALDQARRRLGDKGAGVCWIAADITLWRPERRYGLWHDRAVFHFLTEAADRRRYMAVLNEALAPGGTVVLAAFAPEGPERCSGLPVMRHGPESFAAELGGSFSLRDTVYEDHPTPAGKTQRFCYCRFQLTS
ncbi:MAG: class I SAM-dependent methyltransferase [Magnetospirillum sp. WYHS-4]